MGVVLACFGHSKVCIWVCCCAYSIVHVILQPERNDYTNGIQYQYPRAHPCREGKLHPRTTDAYLVMMFLPFIEQNIFIACVIAEIYISRLIKELEAQPERENSRLITMSPVESYHAVASEVPCWSYDPSLLSNARGGCTGCSSILLEAPG